MQKIKKNIITRANRRILLITSLKSFLFIFLIERLYNLQIIKSEKYKKLAENNRISVSFVIPSRGLIYDRNDRLLADNKEQYQLIFKHEDIEDKFNALNKRTMIDGHVIFRLFALMDCSSPCHGIR